MVSGSQAGCARLAWPTHLTLRACSKRPARCGTRRPTTGPKKTKSLHSTPLGTVHTPCPAHMWAAPGPGTSPSLLPLLHCDTHCTPPVHTTRLHSYHMLPLQQDERCFMPADNAGHPAWHAHMYRNVLLLAASGHSRITAVAGASAATPKTHLALLPPHTRGAAQEGANGANGLRGLGLCRECCQHPLNTNDRCNFCCACTCTCCSATPPATAAPHSSLPSHSSLHSTMSSRCMKLRWFSSLVMRHMYSACCRVPAHTCEPAHR